MHTHRDPNMTSFRKSLIGLFNPLLPPAQFIEIYHDAGQHQKELLYAGVELGKRLVPCFGAGNRSECASKAFDDFIASDLDASVRLIVNKVDAMNKSIDKCCGFEE